MTTKKTQKNGHKWTNDRYYESYEEASNRVSDLVVNWTETKEEDMHPMQTKIRRRANGQYLVKYRKDPTFAKKEKKGGNSNRKNKRASRKGKDDPQTSI